MLRGDEGPVFTGPRAAGNVRGNRAFVRSVLIRLPELTPAAMEECPIVRIFMRLVIVRARDSFRSEASHSELLRSLSSYFTELKKVKNGEESAESLKKLAETISIKALSIPVSKFTSDVRLTLPMLLFFLFGALLNVIIIVIIATSGSCCKSHEEAVIGLSAVVLLILVVLLGLTHQSFKSARSDIAALDELVGTVMDSMCSSVDAEEARDNPLQRLCKPQEDREPDESIGFLVEPEVLQQRKKAIDALLLEAMEDEGNLTLHSKGLPPVTIGLNAVCKHLLMVLTSHDGKVVLWSEGAMAICGFSAHDVEGKEISSLLTGEKSIEQYDMMVGAADKNFDFTSRNLTLAHLTYGSITLSATVVVAREASTGQPVGYALMGSVQQTGISRTLSLFEHFFVTELSQLGYKEPQFRQLLECLQWKNLRDLATAARDWRGVRLRAVLSEVLRERHHQIDVRVLPDVAELSWVSCDKEAVAAVLSRAFELMTGKLHIQVSLKRTTESIHQLVVVFQHDSINPINREALNGVIQAVNDVGGMLLSSTGTLRIQIPFIIEDGSFQPLIHPQDYQIKANVQDPLIILLLEKNAVYRHNISSLLWSLGHSLRVVDSATKALQAVHDLNTDIGCAIVDADIKDAAKVLEESTVKRIYTIETSESANVPSKRGNSFLSKPISRELLMKELAQAARRVEERKRAEEEIVKRREIFGKVRNSPWICGRKLGRGAFADVYEATSTLTGGKMAVKMIRLSDRFEEKVKDLMNEIEILCKLSHPNIIHYFYCERADHTVNLFMELADQGTLADLLQRCPRLPEDLLATITKQLLQAVNYLHESGIIHRDIKPGNMLISKNVLKLSDFGTATANVGEGMHGTIFYMAPEVIEGRSSGKECDIWSIGCVICECLQIKRPSRSGKLLGYGVPESYPDDVSPEVVAFIKACMHDDPSERSTAGTLLLHDFIVKLDHEVENLVAVPYETMTTTWNTPKHTDRFTVDSSSASTAPSW